MIRAVLLGLALLGGVLASPAPSLAQVYRWLDDKGHAHYAEGLDSVPERYRRDARALTLRNSPAPAAVAPAGAAATAGAPAAPGEETIIRFTPGQHIVVDARINGSSTVKLILDTGAAGTLISPRALAAAGVSLTRGVRTARTRGVARDTEVDVAQVPIESLEVGGARVGRMVVASYDMSMTEVEGLLGQDFLGQFNVNIDPAAGVVKLVKK